MKNRRISLAIALTLSLFIVFVFGLSSLMKSGTAAPAPTENSPFRGQVVAVTTDDNGGVCLSHAQVRQLGDRSFLVGKGCYDDHPANWTKGRMVWVPICRIVQIVEFGSEEEMMKAREEYRKKNPVSPQAPSNLAPVPAQAGSQGPSED